MASMRWQKVTPLSPQIDSLSHQRPLVKPLKSLVSSAPDGISKHTSVITRLSGHASAHVPLARCTYWIGRRGERNSLMSVSSVEVV